MQLETAQTLRLRVIKADAEDAVCGSEKHCVIANCIRRTFKGEATSVIVKYNYVRFTYNNMYHRFGMTDVAHNIAVLNDDNELVLSKERTLVLPRHGKPTHAVKVSPERAEAIRLARRKRTAEGYYRERKLPAQLRFARAKSRGNAGKKLKQPAS